MGKKLEFITPSGEVEQVELEITWYVTTGNFYVGLVSYDDGFLEMYLDVTINLESGTPAYHGYIDINEIAGLEEFLTKNDLGHFTGQTLERENCSYPLYQFNVERLRELYPKEMACYEEHLKSKVVNKAQKVKSR